MHFAHKGFTALHIFLSCSMIKWGKGNHSSFGTVCIRSFSILSGYLLSVRPSLCESLLTYVSSTMPSTTPYAFDNTVLAVLQATLGRVERSSIVSGTLELYFSAIIFCSLNYIGLYFCRSLLSECHFRKFLRQL